MPSDSGGGERRTIGIEIDPRCDGSGVLDHSVPLDCGGCPNCRPPLCPTCRGPRNLRDMIGTAPQFLCPDDSFHGQLDPASEESTP